MSTRFSGTAFCRQCWRPSTSSTRQAAGSSPSRRSISARATTTVHRREAQRAHPAARARRRSTSRCRGSQRLPERSTSAGEPVAAHVTPAVESAGAPSSLGGRRRRSDEERCLAEVPHCCMGHRERHCVTGNRGEPRCRRLVPRGSESCSRPRHADPEPRQSRTCRAGGVAGIMPTSGAAVRGEVRVWRDYACRSVGPWRGRQRDRELLSTVNGRTGVESRSGRRGGQRFAGSRPKR